MSWLKGRQKPSYNEEAAQHRAFVERLQQVLEFRPGDQNPQMASSQTAPPMATATYESQQPPVYQPEG